MLYKCVIASSYGLNRLADTMTDLQTTSWHDDRSSEH